MERSKSGLEDLKQIRAIMERSSTFLSLSGFSGVFVGLVALVACCLTCYLCKEFRVTTQMSEQIASDGALRSMIILVMTGALLLALTFAFAFSFMKSKRKKLPLFNAVSRGFAVHFFVPLLTGGIYIVSLVVHGHYDQVLASMLVFYGISLISASKYTLREITWYGVCVLGCGIVAAFCTVYSLVFWAIGFGVCTIGYGIFIYVKYEK